MSAAEPPKTEATASDSKAAAAVVKPTATKEMVLSLVNEARAVRSAMLATGGHGGGLRMLKLSARLCQAAEEHAADMATRGYFDYAPAGSGEGIEARARRLGYGGRLSVNLGRNGENAAQVIGNWLEEDSTRAALFDPGAYELGAGTQAGYWVLLVGAPEEAITDGLRQRMLELVNAERQRLSLPPLALDRQCNYIAQLHCLDMGKRQFYDHANPDGKKVLERAQDAGYLASVYELLSKQVVPEDALAEWLAVPTFRAELLSDRYRNLGVGLFGGQWTVVLGCPFIAAAAPQPVAPGSELKNDLVRLINEQRTAAKAPLLRPHFGLEQIVEGHAADMAAKGFLAYEHPGCPGISGRVKDSGYRGRIFPAITKGQKTADAVIKLFWGSEGHRKNLLDPQFRDLGVAVKDDAWVLLLGAPPAEGSVELRLDFLRLVNGHRTAAGLPVYSLSSLLCSVAQDYASDMARRDFFAFTNPEGKGPDALAKLDGFPGQVLPSLSRGALTADAALAAWMNGEKSRASLLDPKFTLLGIGVSDSRWVLLLGTATT